MNKLFLALAIVAIVSIIAATSVIAFESEGKSVMVPMKDIAGDNLGYIKIKEAHNGLVIQARLQNVPAGWHGFHVNELVSCAVSFKAAKSRYNPQQVSFGIDHGDQRHGSDLSSIYAGENGKVSADTFNTLLTLASGPTTLKDADGSSFIVHSKADSYWQNAGVGGRIACGMISSGN